MSSNGLSAPGSSVYSSDSMYVGDGTWDSQRNTFLLPNLQGLNLATTQYNGMGNRFRNMVGYRSVVKGHGILAAVTFLFVIPAAIFIARFYHRNPRMALRLHIWLQILTVLLSTAVFILGFEAVGLARSLTNPHHGIGVAIYTLILVQAFGGCIIHRREKGKERYKVPLKLMVRGSFVQLQRNANKSAAPSMAWEIDCAPGNCASRARSDFVRLTQSAFHTSYVDDEKYTEDGRRGRTWRDRLLGAGAAAGGIFAFKKLFDRKKHTTTESGSDVSYSRPIGPSEVTQTDLSRVEEGRAPASPGRDHWRRVEEREAAQAAAMAGSPLRHGHRPPRSGASIDSYDSRTSFSDEHDTKPEESHGLRNGIAALGLAGFLRHQWNKRRNKKEDEHVAAIKQQDIEEERIARAKSQRRKYTGDGAPPRRNRPPSTIISESDISGATPAISRTNVPPPPRSTTNVTQTETIAGPSTAPPADPHGVFSDSGSEAYISAGGGRHRRHRNGGTGALAAGAAAAAASAGSPSRRDHGHHRSSGSVASPPVSVKVKMHNDGRHVTLRRLNEEEAAAEREARRRDRQRRNRNGSVSSLSNFEDRERWRRTEAMEAAQAPAPAQPAAPIPMPEPVIPPPPPGPPPGAAFPADHQVPLPPPPPIPAAAGSGLSSPLGTQAYGTETDVSAYDSNRRRRRAERAQAKQARMGGGRVEFS
ncbi:hypothetical protein BU26DRAFT_439970 [Trematosphaeria pertusa]|uniref:Cytochrome b561 domain-containing protein n=1 Tax=Trematosphaeria pertusa TaxID=390896 RepID=A0A6A6HUK1_9PLEO|nr:uncharacterized protein BU26DRAFT_439970 [Trematosphaeria pertusa]KAF2241855.1 hypothetical protein BU26DRAFT_439970 [Trematosphaeria pertusa]